MRFDLNIRGLRAFNDNRMALLLIYTSSSALTQCASNVHGPTAYWSLSTHPVLRLAKVVVGWFGAGGATIQHKFCFCDTRRPPNHSIGMGSSIQDGPQSSDDNEDSLRQQSYQANSYMKYVVVVEGTRLGPSYWRAIAEQRTGACGPATAPNVADSQCPLGAEQ